MKIGIMKKNQWHEVKEITAFPRDHAYEDNNQPSRRNDEDWLALQSKVLGSHEERQCMLFAT